MGRQVGSVSRLGRDVADILYPRADFGKDGPDVGKTDRCLIGEVLWHGAVGSKSKLSPAPDDPGTCGQLRTLFLPHCRNCVLACNIRGAMTLG